MIALWIVLILILILLILLGVAAARALQMKPTSAATAQFPDSDLERAQRYAEALSALVQCETVSEKDQASRHRAQRQPDL